MIIYSFFNITGFRPGRQTSVTFRGGGGGGGSDQCYTLWQGEGVKIGQKKTLRNSWTVLSARYKWSPARPVGWESPARPNPARSTLSVCKPGPLRLGSSRSARRAARPVQVSNPNRPKKYRTIRYEVYLFIYLTPHRNMQCDKHIVCKWDEANENRMKWGGFTVHHKAESTNISIMFESLIPIHYASK